MAVKKFRPTTPSRRQMTMATFEEITTSTPEKSLLVSLNKSGGRNAPVSYTHLTLPTKYNSCRSRWSPYH